MKKILIQTFLFSIFSIILILTFYEYFYKIDNSQKKIEIESSSKKNLIKNNLSNVLYDVSYEKFDEFGNNYKIKAESGELESMNSENIFLTNVEAKIISKKDEIIYITSANAHFNNQNFKTEFFNGVQMKYNDHILASNNLNLLFDENIIEFKNEVVYEYLNTKLYADTIIVDLITKESKIQMHNNNQKVKILSLK